MSSLKSILIWIILIFFLVFSYQMIGDNNLSSKSLSYSEFLKEVDSNNVGSVTISGIEISGTLLNGQNFSSRNPGDPDLIRNLKEANVLIDAQPRDSGMGSFIGIVLSSWFPILLLVGVWIFFMKQMQGGSGRGGAMGFGRSKAKLHSEKDVKVTFKNVAGVDEAKEEVQEIVDFLKDPQKFTDIGGKIPRGCLLVGSPGTGKTLLARAIAGEASVPFFSISGSEFVEMFVGVGASRVRDLFEQGKKNAPCIIFIDEIDAVGRHRGAGMGGGNDEREQTLNQLLVEMDGFSDNEGVIIIAATNRPDVLDPALLRPGRFDRQIAVPVPDIKGREQILKVHMKKVPLLPNVDIKVIARGTPGFSGAELANLVNEAALLAARQNKKVVTMSHLEEAKDKVMMGPERKSMVMDDEEKKLTAYHEAGHAVVGVNCKASDPIHKATIIPRGRALGLVQRLPEKDKVSITRGELNANIAVAMGGRIAEEMIFGYDKVTSGASSDIKMATQVAKAMVLEYGMSDKVGAINHKADQQESFLGRQSSSEVLSEKTAALIDSEIKKFVDDGYKLAEKILKDKIDDLHKVANALLEFETLSGSEINDIISGKEIKKSNSKASSKVKISSIRKNTKKKKED